MAEPNPDFTKPTHVVGQYALYGRLAAGGMATVHLGRRIDSEAGGHTVAVKRLHPQFCKDPEFVAMFIDEARLAARIKHSNVVETLDILTMGQELLLVMEYIRGECFSKLLRAARRKKLEPSLGVVGRITSGMLHGLHAAHEARDDQGDLLNVVHRDISPQNVMVGVDGVAKVLDFGVAKASARIQITRDGQMKGKLSYMSPEQLQGMPVDRRADVFAAGVVLWEALTRRRLFVGEDASEVLRKILKDAVPPPSRFVPDLPAELDAVVLRALSKDPERRYQTAEEAALDIERVVELASPAEVGRWIESVAGEVLGKRDHLLNEIQRVDPAAAPLAPTGGGPVTDSDTFERIQTWAEREAARAVADADEEEIEVEPEPEEEEDEATETQAGALPADALYEDGQRTEIDATADLVDVDDPDSAVTVAQDQPFVFPEPEPQPPQPSASADAMLAPVVHVGAMRRPRRGRRALTWIAAAATFMGLVGLVVFGMDRSSLVRTSGALLPDESIGREPAVEPAVAEPVVESDRSQTEVAQAEPAVEPAPIAPDPAPPKRDVAPIAPPKAPVARGAKRIALTRSPKSLGARYRKARKASRGKSTASKVRRSRKRKEVCREPYYYDSKGIKRLKMECL